MLCCICKVALVFHSLVVVVGGGGVEESGREARERMRPRERQEREREVLLTIKK
jgi:hypothetical protein